MQHYIANLMFDVLPLLSLKDIIECNLTLSWRL